MSQPFATGIAEQAYRRTVFLALEVIDAVTLERRSRGLRVVAEGFESSPIVNAGGLFVWRTEDPTRLRRIVVDPGSLPYAPLAIPAAEVRLPITRVELPPRIDYPFAAGITGLRACLIEERVASPQQPVPVADASVRLRWLDDDQGWRDAPTVSRTDARGSFAAIVRFSGGQAPLVSNGSIRVRLFASRAGGAERHSGDLDLPLGRVADPSTSTQGADALTFAWDELRL
jgi:hypothetical protein